MRYQINIIIVFCDHIEMLAVKLYELKRAIGERLLNKILS